MILQITQDTVFVLEDYSRPGHNTLAWFRRVLSYYPTWDPPVEAEVIGLRVVQFMENGRCALMVELPDDVSEDTLEMFAAHLKDRSYVNFRCDVNYNRNLSGIGWSLFLTTASGKQIGDKTQPQEIFWDRKKVFDGVEVEPSITAKIDAIANRGWAKS